MNLSELPSEVQNALTVYCDAADDLTEFMEDEAETVKDWEKEADSALTLARVMRELFPQG